MEPVIAYIGLGANTGGRQANLHAAVEKMNATEGIRVLVVSRVLENPAVGGPVNSPRFLNAVAKVETTLSPRELLNRLLEIEQEMGRVRREKWGPRVIDLDILLYGDLVVDEEGLKIPHPLMHERRFVLEPLGEIAGDVDHPVLLKTVTHLLAGLK